MRVYLAFLASASGFSAIQHRKYVGFLHQMQVAFRAKRQIIVMVRGEIVPARIERSEEHTSELQSQSNLVCRLLLEKKKKRPRERASPIRYQPARAPVSVGCG